MGDVLACDGPDIGDQRMKLIRRILARCRTFECAWKVSMDTGIIEVAALRNQYDRRR